MIDENIDSNIAIIGMDCQIPGATNISQFWHNLRNGIESISDFSKEELIESKVPLDKINNPKYVARRGIVNGVDKFDAGFFGFTPREAELLDPQHRLFLECCWHSLEDAGYAKRSSKTRVGVFGGAGTAWYLNDVNNNQSVKKYADATSIITGADRDYLTTKVSYKLNLNGPSLNVQSACSSSTAAIILGIQSLQTYQSDLILAGGVSVQYPEKVGYIYASGGMESADGTCRPFDKNANGTVFSRGCGVVLLKRLDEAIADNDHIYSVIRAGSINNDGNRKVGYTAPSIEGQKEILLETIELAGVTAENISMVEAHGTATPVGDPIEVSSLSEAFRTYTDKKQYCALGSLKSNIGHTDTAAGVISVIKTSLSLKNKEIPASINFTEPNPNIDFGNSPFFVNTMLKDWKNSTDNKRLALINSFGVGGTNACLILEEPPIQRRLECIGAHSHKILAFSGKVPTAIDDYSKTLDQFLGSNPEINLNDLEYSSLFRREHFKHRAYVTFTDRDDLLKKIKSTEHIKKGLNEKDNRRLVFMFPGQGNQFVNMGLGLYRKYPVFRKAIDECSELLEDELNLDIRTIIYPSSDNTDGQIDKTYITQPAIFMISYAQALLLKSWGLNPDCYMGHSVGEYVAATLAGVFSLKDALKAVSRRASLIQKLPGGAMTTVLLSEEDILPLLGKNTSIGAINTMGLTVVSGPYDEIEKLESDLSNKRVFNKRVPTSHAFHSAMMDPILNEMEILFKDIKLNKPNLQIISTLTGEELSESDATSVDYWVKHVRNTVRFSRAVTTSMNISPTVFVEVGPGQSLESAVKRHLNEDHEHSVLGTIRPDSIKIDDCEYLINAVGKLWTCGINVDKDLYLSGENPNPVPFPLYPFQKKKYIVNPPEPGINAQIDDDDAKNPDIGDWIYLPTWKKTQNIDVLIKQHSNNSDDNTTRLWLIFMDEIGLAKSIIKSIKNIEEECIIIKPDKEFKKIDKNNYSINIKNKDDYNLLIAELLSTGRTPNRVLHLLNVDNNTDDTNLESCIDAEYRAYYSPLFLEQAFIDNNAMNDLNILFVANGVLDVIGENVLSPLKSLAIGPSRCISREFKSISAKFVDIDAVLTNELELAQNLISETNFRCDDTVIAYRKGNRWAETFDKTYYDKVPDSDLLYKEEGTYLILGGTGGLGVEFAKHIANNVKANIILTYRTPLPERSEWSKFIAENPNLLDSEKIVALMEIESNGSKLFLKQAEVDNYDQMKSVRDFAIQNFGSVNGIIHSAGAAGGGIISLKTKEMSEDVLKAKTRGTLIIDKLFGSDSIDFISYFSSITALTGEASRVDYTSANSFFDVYANYRNQRYDNTTISINWNAWSKVGMAARWDETQLLRRRKLYENENSSIPGIHYLSSKNDVEIYQIGFNENNSWIFKEHSVAGEHTIVGTSIVEIFIKYAIEKFKDKVIHLKDVYFLKPITTPPNTMPLLRLHAIKEDKGVKLELVTAKITVDSDKWDVVAIGHLEFEKPTDHELFNVQESINNLNGKKSSEQMFTILLDDGKEVLKYSDRWANLNWKYRNGNDYIIEQEIDDKYINDFDYFNLHPAMLDTAVANLFRDHTLELYLPYSYKSIRFYGKFTKKMYATISLKSDMSNNPNQALFNINYYNSNGEISMKISDYSLVNMSKGGLSENQPIINIKKNQDSEDYILPDEGVNVFDRIFYYNNGTNVVVTPFNLFKELHNIIHDDISESKKSMDNESNYERPDISSEYVEPTNEIEETIAGIWSQILGIGQIGINDNFNDLGGNSLLAVQAISNTSQAFAIELTADILGDAPTIKSLSDHIMGLLMEDLDDIDIDNILDDI